MPHAETLKTHVKAMWCLTARFIVHLELYTHHNFFKAVGKYNIFVGSIMGYIPNSYAIQVSTQEGKS